MSGDLALQRVLSAARRRIWVLVLCVVLTPAAAIGISFLQHKEYTAKAFLLFRDPQFDQKLFGSSFIASPNDPTREAATNLELVSLETVAARTAKRLHVVTPDQVSNAVHANNEGQADIASVSATWKQPRFAATLANTFAQEYIQFRRDADRAKIQQAETPLKQQFGALSKQDRAGPLGQSLAQRLDQLNTLASLQTGNAELVQSAQVPTSPSSPKRTLDAALGLLIGLALGAGLVALLEALDRRLRDPGDVEQAFGAPILAALPESASLKKPSQSLSSMPEPEREAFRMLRANLRYFSLSRDINSLIITSADRGEGKSTVAWGLAMAAASSASRTLLVEADLRHPSFAGRYKLDPGCGLSSVLAGEFRLEDAVQYVPLEPGGDNGSPDRSLHVLAAGPLPPNPTDLVESEQLKSLLERAEREYDLVVIDTPPAAIVSDAIPLVTRVGGVIVVSRLGTSLRSHAHRLHQQFENLDAPVLGIVLNSVDRRDEYAYGYGTAAPPSREAPAPVERRPATRDARQPRNGERAVQSEGGVHDEQAGVREEQAGVREEPAAVREEPAAVRAEPTGARTGAATGEASDTPPSTPPAGDEDASPQKPPAGWYPDPAGPGHLRWWDGGRWTGHTHAAVAADNRQGRVREGNAREAWPGANGGHAPDEPAERSRRRFRDLLR